MSELVVVGFKNDKYRASDVLDQLRQLDFDWVIDLDDAVAVYRDYDGRLRVQQSYELTTGEGAAWGGLWGSLIGAVLAIPFAGGASAAAAAGAVAAGVLSGTAVGATAGAIDAMWWKEPFGIDEDLSAMSARSFSQGTRRSSRCSKRRIRASWPPSSRGTAAR